MAKIVYSHMKDYANTMRSLCIVHSGASVSLIYARMRGGWGVYGGTVAIHAMTVPALRPPFVLRVFFTCAHDAGVVRACAYFCIIIIITSKQVIPSNT